MSTPGLIPALKVLVRCGRPGLAVGNALALLDDRWGCRVFGHDRTIDLGFCWRCLTEVRHG